MPDIYLSIFTPIISGILLLLIEYFLISPLRQKLNLSDIKKTENSEVKISEKNEIRNSSQSWTWLYSKNSFAITSRIFISITLLLIGLAIFENLLFQFRNFEELSPLTPLLISLQAILGLSITRVSFEIIGPLNLIDILKSFFYFFAYIVLISNGFFLLLVIQKYYIVILENFQYIYYITNSLAGLFFCIYLGVAMYSDATYSLRHLYSVINKFLETIYSEDNEEKSSQHE